MKDEKERKNTSIEFRCTQAEKDMIKEYCAERGMTVSELVRIALNRTMNIQEGK